MRFGLRPLTPFNTGFLDVCLIIGEPFASFVAEHHPRRARWTTADEAVQILHAEDERGHAHPAFFKDAIRQTIRDARVARKAELHRLNANGKRESFGTEIE
jgi:hypothetical protein